MWLKMRSKEVDEIFKKALDEGRSFLFEHEAKKLCKEYGMPVTKTLIVTSEEEALNAAELIGFPVVLKIISPQILHKSDAGGVILGIHDGNDLRSSFSKIISNIKQNTPEAEIKGVLVQEMIPQSTEIIVGSTIDPTFGSTIMFGLGGIFVEVLEDVSFRLIPISENDAWEMIHEIKGRKILEGARRNPIVDKKIIVDILMKTSKMLSECTEITELDLNPIMVYENSVTIVDARIVL